MKQQWFFTKMYFIVIEEFWKYIRIFDEEFLNSILLKDILDYADEGKPTFTKLNNVNQYDYGVVVLEKLKSSE